MRTRSGFRSQLSFVPQSPNGPAGLSLAGPYYFQPECALFVTNKATEGQKEAAGENDAALVSAWSASHHSPMPDLPECSNGQERCSSCRLVRTPHMVRHACGFALANRGHDTRALQAYLGHRNVSIRALYELSPTLFQEFLARMTAPEPLASCFRTPHKLRQSADPRCCW